MPSNKAFGGCSVSETKALALDVGGGVGLFETGLLNS
jgi:hypothetical protein